LKAGLEKTGNLTVEILKWNEKECSWNQNVSTNTNKVTYSIFKLKTDARYALKINGKLNKSLISDKNGRVKFDANIEVAKALISIHLQ
jgi:hypothetical protein